MYRKQHLTSLERQQRLTALALGGSGLLILGGQRWGLHLAWRCPLRALTGIPCPTCGITRSLTACLAGNWSQAVAEHAFGPLLLGMGFVGLLGWSLELYQDRSLPWLRLLGSKGRDGSVAVALSLLTYHAVRLIDWWQTGQLKQWMSVAWLAKGS